MDSELEEIMERLLHDPKFIERLRSGLGLLQPQVELWLQQSQNIHEIIASADIKSSELHEAVMSYALAHEAKRIGSIAAFARKYRMQRTNAYRKLRRHGVSKNGELMVNYSVVIKINDPGIAASVNGLFSDVQPKIPIITFLQALKGLSAKYEIVSDNCPEINGYRAAGFPIYPLKELMVAGHSNTVNS